MITEKDKVREVIYAQRDQFLELARDIHDHPELAFYEEYSTRRLTEFLAAQGFFIQRGVCGMPTAFIATFGHGPLHIALCAEYDALPPTSLFDRSEPPDLVEVWLSPERKDVPLLHACGHHLIAGAAIAAAIGLRDLADKAGLTISVFGTPAEEMYGLPEPRDGRLAPGKVELLEGGAFGGVHAVLMIHPFPTPFSVIIPSKASLRLRAQFASGGAGGCALDISKLKQLEGELKQTILSFHQIPALFVARPEEKNTGAQADIFWIASTLAEMKSAREAVRRCIETAAFSAGVRVQIIEYAPGVEMCHDPLLRSAFRKNSKLLGRVRANDARIQTEIRKLFEDQRMPRIVRLLARLSPRLVTPAGLFMDKFPMDIVYGTDLGNVSEVIPAIHPFIGIGGTSGCHMAEFAADADTEEAYQAMLDGGIALAWTALDAATDPTLRAHLLSSGHKGSNSRNN
jgi:metal-dependent amidase/aminoacylase/carboxypeptidase family protein